MEIIPLPSNPDDLTAEDVLGLYHGTPQAIYRLLCAVMQVEEPRGAERSEHGGDNEPLYVRE